MNRSLKLDADPAIAPPAGPAPKVRTEAEIVRELQSVNVKRMEEIDATAEQVFKSTQNEEVRALAREAIRGNTSVEEFHKLVLTRCMKAKPVSTPNEKTGLSRKDIRGWSISKEILNRLSGREPEGLQKEINADMEKRTGRRAQGFYIPTEVVEMSFAEANDLDSRGIANLEFEVAQMKRALTSNVFSAGGALVGTDLMTGSLIELLRNKMVVAAMGARHLTGLVGDVAIPKHTGGATAYWLAQGATGTRSQQTFAQVALTPRRLFGSTQFDKQLLAQSSLSVEAFVREDLMTVLAIEKDRAAINGSGASGEPLGILNQVTGSTSTLVTFATAAAPLWTEIIKFETNLATNNADFGNIGFICTPAVRGHCKGFPKFASTGTPIWDQNDTLNGYKAMVSNQVPTTKSVIFGNWSDLILADWDGMDVVVNPFAADLEGQIRVTLQTFTDVAVRQGKSFTYATN